MTNRKVPLSFLLAGLVCWGGLFGTTNHQARAQVLLPHPPATTVQLPTFGVSIDATGVLSLQQFDDPGGNLRRTRLMAARATLSGDLQATSNLRYVSLVRLEQAIRQRVAQGEPLTEAMQYLAGLQRIEYVLIYPESGDVVIAGQAEGWAVDPSGRPVGMSTLRPVLQLVDLCVALRQFPPGSQQQPFLGCTINPRQEGLARLVEFQRTIPSTIPNNRRGEITQAIVQGTRQALGDADILTFGVSPRTHFAHVLIEADYRMKRIGIGLEEPPVHMTTFLSAARSAQEAMLQRWWFAPNYECLRLSEDHLAMQMVGQGVQLLGEDHQINAQGELTPSGAPVGRASGLFTHAFTQKYDEIATASPVYAQLRQMIDFSVVAAYLCHFDAYGQTRWNAACYRDEGAISTETLPNPQQVPCAVNAQWRGSRLLSPAGGGVSIRPMVALEAENLLPDTDGAVAARHYETAQTLDDESWWWDEGPSQ